MADRIFNFNAGPSTLPLEVLQKVQNDLLDYRSSGMSIMEMSHRSPEYDEINDGAISLTRELMSLSDDYHVLFLGGGASTQFAMIPLNFLHPGKKAAYVDTGAWSTRAIKEAKNVGELYLAGSSADKNYNFIPDPTKLEIPSDTAYLHLTSNNTIFGTQYHSWPETGEIPLICDMSSDIFSRQLDFGKFSMIYAGAQKNLGPAGVTMAIIKDDLLASRRTDNLTITNYGTHADKKSLYNTPPVFPIYVVWLVLNWIKDQGGLAAVEKKNRAKMELLYSALDNNADYYKGTVEKSDRSWMNVTFRLPSEELEKKFISEAKSERMGGLKGHRSVGGVRASIYNAMTLEGVKNLVEFMDQFKKKNN